MQRHQRPQSDDGNNPHFPEAEREAREKMKLTFASFGTKYFFERKKFFGPLASCGSFGATERHLSYEVEKKMASRRSGIRMYEESFLTM